MWQTDTVTLQTPQETNNLGSISVIWQDQQSVLCDVQYISKEKVFNDYGFTDSNEFLQVFDHNLSNWVEGNQVKYNGNQYWVKLVQKNLNKINLSNHVYVILARVIL